MGALIYVNLDAVHPVIDGVWHRARLPRVPAPGEVITMLCGASAAAEFEHSGQRDVHGVPKQCWDCERVYRREHGIDPPPEYPPPGRHLAPHPR